MKMLLKRNLLENITIKSNCGTIICILLHYLTDVSLLSGKWLLLYICAVFFASVFFSFKVIQWLLLLNKPLSYDLDGFVEKYPYLAPIRRVLPELPKQVKHEWKEYDTNELSVISTVLERKLVSSWYVPYISQEIGFPFACKQMLDQMIGKAFQICSNIDTKDVFVDTCTILTLHFKEYEKAVKRHEKIPSIPIEDHYKKSHPISNPDSKYTSVEHCTKILRIIIKELLPWELRDTPHSELLVRILSKKLDGYIDSTIANPIWLNDKLLTYLTGQQYVEAKKEDNNPKIQQKVPKEWELAAENAKNENIQEIVKEINTESNGNKSPAKTEMVIDEGRKTPEIDLKASPVLRQKRGRQGRNEVKIYDRVIEGSEKTWETDMDLQCISLGQDLLASLDGEITLSRLWGHEEAEGSPELGGKSPHLWTAGEEETAPLGPLPTSPSPGDVLLKDLQETVSQAKHRIEDLQVKPLDSDEAAGMMEGLLDFGIAGLKKGLRFTGLSDDTQEKSPSHSGDRGDKSPPLEWGKRADDRGTAGEHKEDNVNGVPQLVKQHRVSSQDSVPSNSRAVPIPLSESPEPQYEEAADLSTSIAKLRRLLRQRADGPQQATSQREGEGEVWWEGAEETRGRTQRHQSSRPVDSATLADEYDMSMGRHSPNQGSNNNMQRLDKLFHRTVTGVFNSLKTAVGADELAPPPATDWAYVHTNNELSVCVGAARLAWARRARGVDAALDSLHALPAPRAPPAVPPEDLDEWVSQSARAWGAAAAVCGVLHSHVAHRLASLLLAEAVESLITSWLSSLANWLRAQIFLQFSRMEGEEGKEEEGVSCRPFDVEETCDAICQRLTGANILFGSTTIRHRVRLAVRACRTPAARDVVYRVLDSLVAHFKAAAQVRHPSFDNN